MTTTTAATDMPVVHKVWTNPDGSTVRVALTYPEDYDGKGGEATLKGLDLSDLIEPGTTLGTGVTLLRCRHAISATWPKIGRRCRLGDGVRLQGGCVLESGVTVGVRSSLQEVRLGQLSELGQEVRIEDSNLPEKSRVGARSALKGIRLTEEEGCIPHIGTGCRLVGVQVSTTRYIYAGGLFQVEDEATLASVTLEGAAHVGRKACLDGGRTGIILGRDVVIGEDAVVETGVRILASVEVARGAHILSGRKVNASDLTGRVGDATFHIGETVDVIGELPLGLEAFLLTLFQKLARRTEEVETIERRLAERVATAEGRGRVAETNAFTAKNAIAELTQKVDKLNAEVGTLLNAKKKER